MELDIKGEQRYTCKSGGTETTQLSYNRDVACSVTVSPSYAEEAPRNQKGKKKKINT